LSKYITCGVTDNVEICEIKTTATIQWIDKLHSENTKSSLITVNVQNIITKEYETNIYI